MWDRRLALLVGMVDALVLALLVLAEAWTAFVVVAVAGGLLTSVTWTVGRDPGRRR